MVMSWVTFPEAIVEKRGPEGLGRKNLNLGSRNQSDKIIKVDMQTFC
jgi:hypothetical protein